jgi:hypothetical protein
VITEIDISDVKRRTAESLSQLLGFAGVQTKEGISGTEPEEACQ